MKIVVIGAGIVGITSAYYLSRSGHDVTVIEQNGTAAAGCSHANGGFISPSYCGPWAAPGVPTMALKALLTPHAPMRWRPDFTLRQIRWLLAMARECSADRFATNRRRMLALGTYSGRCLDEVELETGLSFERRRSGILQPCRSAAELAAAAKQEQSLRANAIDVRLLTRDEVTAREPALVANVPELTGALYLSDEGSGRCESFAPALARWLESRGVRFLWNARIKALNIETDSRTRSRRLASLCVGNQTLEADACVVAAGPDTPALLAPHLAVPIYPVKGFSMTARVIDESRAPSHAVLDPRYQLAIARFDDVVRVAGYADVVGYDSRLDEGRCRQLAEVFNSLYPGAADTQNATFWAGLRPMTPDGTPIVGACDIHGLYINAGHGTYGWTMSCGSASLLNDIIGGRQPTLPAADYALARYARTH